MHHRSVALLLFIGIGLSLAQGDFSTDYDLFIADDELLDSYAQTLTQDSNNYNNVVNFDTFLPFDDVNGANTDLFAECASTDRLGARDDEKSTCSTTELTIPHFPTLDELTDMSEQLDPNDRPLTSDEVPLFPAMDPQAKQDDMCPPERPFYLCCICEAKLRFSLCQDCLPSRFYFLLTCACSHI